MHISGFEYDNFQDKPEYVGFWHMMKNKTIDERNNIISEFKQWFADNMIEISDWRMLRGYIGMRLDESEYVGVYFRQTDHALLFRLRFGL